MNARQRESEHDNRCAHFQHDHRWKFEGALEALMHKIGMFDRKDALNVDGFEGSGADWLEQYKPYIEDGKTVVTSPHKVSLAYTPGSKWRNRAEFVNGRPEIVQFLQRKWARELDYRLIKELWALSDNRIAVRFTYEWHDDAGNWFRSYGNENWEFDDSGLMRLRIASINDLPISESQRLYHWPLGRRPDGHQGLSELDL